MSISLAAIVSACFARIIPPVVLHGFIGAAPLIRNEYSLLSYPKGRFNPRTTMIKSIHRTSRYGIYLSPHPQSSLYQLGSSWLGRDATTGEDLDPGLSNGIAIEDWRQATESPRRYGFHATLKPPFRLAHGARYNDLLDAVYALADRYACFETPPLKIEVLGKFLALTLSHPSPELSNLAAACVNELDRFRAPATEEERDRRLQDTLSPREREHVFRWGYPYVFDTWNFHMSLTGSLPSEAVPRFQKALMQRFALVCGRTMLVDSICIFHEPSPGTPFYLIEQLDLRPR